LVFGSKDFFCFSCGWKGQLTMYPFKEKRRKRK